MEEVAGAVISFGIGGFVVSILICVFVEGAFKQARSEDMGVALIVTTTTLFVVIGILLEYNQVTRVELEALQKMAVEAGLGGYTEQVTATKKVSIIKKAEAEE